MDQAETSGREALAVQDKPETLEQCHAVIERMGQLQVRVTVLNRFTHLGTPVTRVVA